MLFHLLGGKTPAAGLQRTESNDLLALPMILSRQRGSSGFDAVQAHAQAVFDHRHGVVAEAAERAQIVGRPRSRRRGGR